MGKDQEFLEAARTGNFAFIEKVLSQKAKRAGPLASLRRGPGVNVQDQGGYSALHHACINGHIDIVHLLLIHDASPNLPDSRGSSPLHLAAWAGHQDIVKMLLTQPYKPANPNMQTIEHETPLHCAAQHGHTGALAILLAHGANPSMCNTRGETPLDLAAQYGRLQAVQMLIRAHPKLILPYSREAIESSGHRSGSASSSAQTRRNSLPHSGSVSTPSPSSPSMLSSPTTPTRNIFPHTCLHLASRNGHKSVVEVLLAAGVSVNLLTPSGSALHEAALCGKESVVRTLLQAGIDLNATDAEGRTALDLLREFPPHVTKNIVAVINNFRNQMDTDDCDEVVYRQHPLPSQQQQQQQHSDQQLQYSYMRNSNSHNNNSNHYQKQQQHQLQQQQHQQQQQQQQQQQHNNHYHFNSNNHLLNHSHSMQQASYNSSNSASGGGGGSGKQRYPASGNFNSGKSLDSGLQPDDISGSCGSATGSGSGVGGRFFHDINSPVHSHSNTSQNDMGVSPSSSMSSFEPVSVSPRSRSSTGGIIGFGGQQVHLSSFAPLPSTAASASASTTAPPKKPPRRNLSVSPTHTGQQFNYTSPNHYQQQQQQQGIYHPRRQQRSSSNDSPYSHQSHGSVGGMSFDETQLRDRQRSDRLYASARESTRSASGIAMSSSNEILDQRSFSNDQIDENSVPNSSNQDLSNSMKRPKPAPRNFGSISKEIINCENPTLKSYNPNRKLKRNRNSCSLTISDKDRSSDSNNSDPSKQQTQPSSPTHYQQPPTPEHPPPSSTQAERTIHERIRPLSQEYKRRSALLQMQQQQFLVESGTSPPKQLPVPVYDYMNIKSPSDHGMLPLYNASSIQGSSGSLSSNISEQSGYSDCVEEFVGDMPFAGLFKGSTANVKRVCNNLTNGRNFHEEQRTTTSGAASTESKAAGLAASQIQRTRPPLPNKPALPERKYFRTTIPIIPPQIPQQLQKKNPQEQQQQEKLQPSNDNTPKSISDLDIDKNSNTHTIADKLCNENSANKLPQDDISQQSIPASLITDTNNESSNEDAPTITTTTTATATGNDTSHEGSILSPFNAEEARKKISEIIESFGSNILTANITPTHDIELDFDEHEVPPERYELAVRLRNAGLLQLERILFENGYDNYKFVHGVFEAADVQLLHIPEKDGARLLRFISTLPQAVFQPQAPLKHAQQENKPSKATEVQDVKNGVTTLSQWLQSINLPEYVESFNKHLYNSIDSVCGVWDVELQTVLEINKLGHRRRILQSLAYIRHMREPKSAKTPLGENNETNKMSSNGLREPVAPVVGQKTANTVGHQKKRPAPPPPIPKVDNKDPASTVSEKQQKDQVLSNNSNNNPVQVSAQGTEASQQQDEVQELQIRAPSELLLGLPDNLRTKWRHSANVLLNEQIKYEVYYLGSTVVKELRGTESTRKSIQKLKGDNSTTTNMMSSVPEHSRKQHKLARNSSFNGKKCPRVYLAISHQGVEFIDVIHRLTICEHEIQNINCACQDAEDLRLFAYITKENDIHYCHVFKVNSADLATEIILTLGQAFEVAYQLALRDGIVSTPMALNNSILQGSEKTTVAQRVD